jgi:hypothetical protein
MGYYTGENQCDGCRYWSEMIARAGGWTTNPRGDTEALCLAKNSPYALQYTTGETTCLAFARNTCGAVDEPPDYGAAARAAYARQAAMQHPNGKPYFAPDGTPLDDKGNRSIFDDVDLCGRK